MVVKCVAGERATPPLLTLITDLNGTGPIIHPVGCGDIVLVLNELGVKWRAYQIDTSHLERIPPLSIVHTGDLDSGHFRIMLGTEPKQVILWDGVLGIMYQDRKRFVEEFSGYVVASAQIESSHFLSWYSVGGILVAIAVLVAFRGTKKR